MRLTPTQERALRLAAKPGGVHKMHRRTYHALRALGLVETRSAIMDGRPTYGNADIYATEAGRAALPAPTAPATQEVPMPLFTGIAMTETDRAMIQVERLIKREIEEAIERLDHAMPESEGDRIALAEERGQAIHGAAAVTALLRAPTFGPNHVRVGLLASLLRLHRTEQAKVVDTMLGALRDYALVAGTDGRNEQAVARCRKLL